MEFGNDSEAFAQFVQSQAANRRAVSLSELIREWESIQGQPASGQLDRSPETKQHASDNDEF